MNKFINLIYRHRYDIFFSFILFVIFIFGFIFLQNVETKNLIKTLENKSFDIRQNIISKNKKVNKDIIIVTVDDPSYEYLIETYGDWPIPRNAYAEILDYIQNQKPKYVAFDLLFIKSLNRIPNSDNKLIEGFKKYKNTYTAFNFDDYSFDLRKPPSIDEKIKSKIKVFSDNFYPYEYTNCRIIMPEIINATKNIGHINTPKSDDGYTRTVPIIVKYPKYNQTNYTVIQDDYYLYMTVKMIIDYLNEYENENIEDLVIDSNNNLLLGKRKIPLTEKGEAILNWYGKSGTEVDTTFKYVSFWQIFKSIQAKKEGTRAILPDNLFEDKIVYIGTNVFALSDIKTVPTSKYLPGVEIHATLFNNILDNSLIHNASLPYNILISIILSAAVIFTVFRIKSVYVSLILFAFLTVTYSYFTTYVMEKYNVWVWLVIPVACSIFLFICSFIIKYLLKSRDFEYTYKLATTDGLTELYNHRFFQEQIRQKIIQSEKNKTNFSLILIDIDFFKKFNDKYGHQAGDAVLKHVASTLKKSVRSEDLVCRYGGEEMTIILNNTNRNDAIKTAQKICEIIAEKKYELTPELEVNITISLGVSTYPENGKTPTELIEYADKCLYKAKENGRNQVGFIS